MKLHLLLLVLVVCTLSGCAYNETVIYNSQGIVYCLPRVDKPVAVTPSVQADGNTVPMLP